MNQPTTQNTLTSDAMQCLCCSADLADGRSYRTLLGPVCNVCRQKISDGSRPVRISRCGNVNAAGKQLMRTQTLRALAGIIWEN